MPANDVTHSTLNKSDPKIPPRPTSDSTTNDEMTFVKNSGAIVALFFQKKILKISQNDDAHLIIFTMYSHCHERACGYILHNLKKNKKLIFTRKRLNLLCISLPLTYSNLHKCTRLMAKNNHDTQQLAMQRNK